VRAVAHELGNLLAGIRLTGHFLGEDVTSAERKRWSGDIEFLSAQAGAWAALIAPLSEGKTSRTRTAPAELLAAVHWSVVELEGGGRLRVPTGRGAPPVQIDKAAMHQLLVLLTTSALADGTGGSVRLALSARPRHVVLSVLDEAAPLEPEGAAARRGRELMREVGDALLRPNGGRLEYTPRREGNRFDLWLPKAPRAKPGGAAAESSR